MPHSLQIGGFTPLTTIDFPGELAAVVFCQGCPWRCRYCHNSHLIPVCGVKSLAWEEILQFLERRRGLLDAVVFSGGEPTLQKGLQQSLQQVRALGFKTGLHTAGPWPERLAALLPYLDWVGMDLKATVRDYPRVTGVPRSGERAWQSAQRLLDAGMACEFRVTVHPMLLNEQQLDDLKQQALLAGIENLQVQPCITNGCLNSH